MDKIGEKLFLGDLTDSQEKVLREHGITAVMSCVMPDERIFIGAAEVKRSYININDGEEYPFHWLTKALEQLDQWLQDGETVLVHCAAGISRSPTTVIAYLMGFGMTWDDAEKAIRACRPFILPHSALKRSVLKYYRAWPYNNTLGDPNE